MAYGIDTSWRDRAKALLRKLGYEVHQFDAFHAPLARRALLMRQQQINLVLDVGANAGQYALDLRQYGYRQRIVSFEPLSAAFESLRQNAATDPLWEVEPFGLGSEDASAELHIGQSTQCSSLLNVLPTFVEHSPVSAFVGSEEVALHRLDTIFDRYRRPGDRVYLKLDVQGYERTVLEGAQEALAHISGVQMELSLLPLYEGETLLADMIRYMERMGFLLMSIEPTFVNADTGQMIQVDGIFIRSVI